MEDTQSTAEFPIPDKRTRLVQEIQSVIAEAETWLDSNAAAEEDGLAEVRSRFEETLANAKSDLLELETDLFATTRRAALATDAYVNENAWRSVTIAGAAGVLIGWLISRK